MSTIFLQQILSGRLLLVVIVGTKSNLNVSFKFEPITTNHNIYILRNDMSTIFLQQILSGRLLLLGQKVILMLVSNLNQ